MALERAEATEYFLCSAGSCPRRHDTKCTSPGPFLEAWRAIPTEAGKGKSQCIKLHLHCAFVMGILGLLGCIHTDPQVHRNVPVAVLWVSYPEP